MSLIYKPFIPTRSILTAEVVVLYGGFSYILLKKVVCKYILAARSKLTSPLTLTGCRHLGQGWRNTPLNCTIVLIFATLYINKFTTKLCFRTRRIENVSLFTGNRILKTLTHLQKQALLVHDERLIIILICVCKPRAELVEHNEDKVLTLERRGVGVGYDGGMSPSPWYSDDHQHSVTPCLPPTHQISI